MGPWIDLVKANQRFVNMLRLVRLEKLATPIHLRRKHEEPKKTRCLRHLTPNESVAPGANAPPASDTGNAFSVTEVTLDLLQGVLLLF